MTTKGPTLRAIKVTDRQMRDVSAHAWVALMAANDPPTIFQRGGLLVGIVKDDAGRPTIRVLDKAAFRNRLDRVADFFKLDARGDPRPAHPPDAVVQDMMADANLPPPLLRGIVHAPVFSRSGQLYTEPGYHQETEFYYVPQQELSIPPVDAHPSPDAIAKARHLIMDELLGDFPFMEDADRANAVGLLLLPFCRLLISGTTPLHLIESPTPGTGKGLLADVLAIPTQGQGLSGMVEGGDDDE